MLQAPELDTQRLTLRAHRLDDFDDSAAMWADPEVTRFIGGKPFSRSECWSRLLRHSGHWYLLGFGYWVVRERVSGRFIGEVGFADLKREVEPRFDGTPEAGWALATWARGRGFATEAVKAVVEWGEQHFGAVRTVCLIDPDNLASLRVAAKCGYIEAHRTTLKGEPLIVFERGAVRS